MDKFEMDLKQKSTEMGNLITSKVLSTKTEFNESLQEVRRNFKSFSDQINIDEIRKFGVIRVF